MVLIQKGTPMSQSTISQKGHSYVPKYNFSAIIQNLKIKHVPMCSAGSWPVLQKKEKTENNWKMKLMPLGFS